MSGSDMDDKAKLALLDELVLHEILATPDRDLLDETSEGGVSELRAELSAALAKAGKQRLARAKAAVALDRARPRRGASSTVGQPPRPSAVPGRLTMAARGASLGEGAGADGIDEDLAELDAWVDEDRARR